jgi:hypothetical protein
MRWLLPALLRVRVGSMTTLWLPLFLLWPLVLAVFSIGLVVTVCAPGPRLRHWACLTSAWQLLCATRGSHVDVCSPGARVLVSIH